MPTARSTSTNRAQSVGSEHLKSHGRFALGSTDGVTWTRFQFDMCVQLKLCQIIPQPYYLFVCLFVSLENILIFQVRILLLQNDLQTRLYYGQPQKKEFVTFSDSPKILRHILRYIICFWTQDTCITVDIDIVLAKAET